MSTREIQHTVEPAAPYGSKENAVTALECLADIATDDAEIDEDEIPERTEELRAVVLDYIENMTAQRDALRSMIVSIGQSMIALTDDETRGYIVAGMLKTSRDLNGTTTP